MSQSHTKRNDDFSHLFPDQESCDQAMADLDLNTQPDEGLETRTQAVFEVALENEARREVLAKGTLKRVFRCVVLVVAVGILVARWVAGPGTHPDQVLISHNPLVRIWATVDATLFSQPDYVARPPVTADQRQARLLAAFHQLVTDLVEVMIWAVALLTAVLLIIDLARRRRRDGPVTSTQQQHAKSG